MDEFALVPVSIVPCVDFRYDLNVARVADSIGF